MFIISRDSYFLKGASILSESVGTYFDSNLVVYDRGDGKVLIFNSEFLFSIMGEDFVENFREFICTKFIYINKNAPLPEFRSWLVKIADAFLNASNSEIYSYNKNKTIRLNLVERNILRLYLEGKTLRDISEKLCLDVKTVSHHKGMILHKININSIASLFQIYNIWLSHFQYTTNFNGFCQTG